MTFLPRRHTRHTILCQNSEASIPYKVQGYSSNLFCSELVCILALSYEIEIGVFGVRVIFVNDVIYHQNTGPGLKNRLAVMIP